MDNQVIEAGKTNATLAYCTLLGALIAISINTETKNEFARLHCQQAFGLHLCFHAVAISLSFLDIGILRIPLYIIYLILILQGILKARKGVVYELPFLGKYFKEWFSFIQ